MLRALLCPTSTMFLTSLHEISDLIVRLCEESSRNVFWIRHLTASACQSNNADGKEKQIFDIHQSLMFDTRLKM